MGGRGKLVAGSDFLFLKDETILKMITASKKTEKIFLD